MPARIERLTDGGAPPTDEPFVLVLADPEAASAVVMEHALGRTVRVPPAQFEAELQRLAAGRPETDVIYAAWEL
jgi:hypothetical protein